MGPVTSVDDVAGPGDLPFRTDVEVALLLVSPRHRYEGRPADGALPAEGPELRDRIDLRAGLGIVGDRYFAARAHVHATVTVIGLEGLDAVAEAVGAAIDPAATRRNVYLRGADVEALRGEPFSLESPGSGASRSRSRARGPAARCASGGTGRRTRAHGWTTRWRRGPSGRCGGAAGCGVTRSPTVCSPSAPRCSARRARSRSDGGAALPASRVRRRLAPFRETQRGRHSAAMFRCAGPPTLRVAGVRR